MAITVLRHIKNAEEVLGVLRKEFEDNPTQIFTITIEQEQNYNEEDMPDEELISEELIKAVQESDKSYKSGKYIRCETKEEREALFKSAWND
jgi:hypothetical protein